MPVPTHGPVAAGSPHAVWEPLPWSATRLLESGHLGAWQVTASGGTIDHCVEEMDESGVLDNFRLAAGEQSGPFRGPLFADSDLYKTLEAVAWDTRADRTAWVADVVGLLRAAQEDSGYLNTWFQTTTPGVHYDQLRDGHELYCLGHLIQAAIAWHRTTGDRSLLDVAVRFADDVVDGLGGDVPDGYCGHPEIETALVELYRETGTRAYLDLARTMVDRRGRGVLANDHVGPRYYQDHTPVLSADEATGHAVRQVYLATGVINLYLERGDPALLAYAERMWSSVHDAKMYVTGGLGARHRDESFGDAYELPSERAYAETCAAIADVMWSWRMLLASGDGRYADAMEWALLNAVAVGAAQDGRSFFYSNPLQVRSTHAEDTDWNSFVHRAAWFGCACCPPNLGRLVASLGHYAATTAPGELHLHLYSDAEIAADGIALRVRSGYPYDGRVEVDADATQATTLRLRIPAWTTDWSVQVGGRQLDLVPERGYVAVDLPVGRSTVVLELDLVPRALRAHPHVDAVRGCVAVARGPLLFALEGGDLPDGVVVEDVQIVPEAWEVVAGLPGLDAPVALRARGRHRPAAPGWVYSTGAASTGEGSELDLTLVPYHRWGNRRHGPGMRVWVPEAAR